MTRQVSETILESLLERIGAAHGPVRQVEVDLTAGIITSPDDILSMPLDTLDLVLLHNPHLADLQHIIVAHIRNVGGVAVSVGAIDFYCAITFTGVDEEAESSLLGRNDFGRLNHSLPYRLANGDAVR